MGCNNSANSQDISAYEVLDRNFTQEDLNNVRNQGNEKTSLQTLASLGMDCTKIEPKQFPPTLGNCCLICINSKTQNENDSAFYNDGALLAEHAKSFGYPIFYLVNPESMQYFTFLRLALSRTSNNMICYVNGFCRDVENDNLICFSNEEVECKRFSGFLLSYKLSSLKVSLFFDVCHLKEKSVSPHSIFISNDLPQNIIMSAIDFIDPSDVGDKKEVKCQGYLIYSLLVALHKKSNKTFTEVESQINSIIQRNGYRMLIVTQNQDMKNQPVFIHLDRGEIENEEIQPARVVSSQSESHNNNNSNNENDSTIDDEENEENVSHIENA